MLQICNNKLYLQLDNVIYNIFIFSNYKLKLQYIVISIRDIAISQYHYIKDI